MKLCVDCGTPLTADEITYLDCWCNGCEGRSMAVLEENERDTLVVDSQFDDLTDTETVIVQTRPALYGPGVCSGDGVNHEMSDEGGNGGER